MKLYDSIGPNPHVVRMVLAEKGARADRIRLDLPGGENRREPYLSVNPLGQVPALELEDGTVITEITAIAEYLDEVYPDPPLLGRSAAERALTRMWTRRVDLMICEPLTRGYQWGDGLAMFEARTLCVPQAAAGMRAIAVANLAWLDGQMAGRPWVAGARFSLADIVLFCFTRFGGKVGQPLDPALTNLQAWYGRAAARASAKA